MNKSYKSQPVKTTVAAAIGDGFSEIQSLADEMREAADNLSGANMEHLPKYEVTEEAANELEQHVDEPDMPACVADLEVATTEFVPRRKGRAPSRAVRLSNALALIQAARDVADAFEVEDDEESEEAEADREAVEALVQELDEHCEFDVEFPGMFG